MGKVWINRVINIFVKQQYNSVILYSWRIFQIQTNEKMPKGACYVTLTMKVRNQNLHVKSITIRKYVLIQGFYIYVSFVFKIDSISECTYFLYNEILCITY